MLSPVLFTFQIILLVTGFSFGYLFLIKAKTQENKLKTIGEILGWILIGATSVLAILNFFYTITIVNNSIQKIYFPINSTDVTQQQEIQEGNAPPIESQETSPENKNKPIKRDINDHE